MTRPFSHVQVLSLFIALDLREGEKVGEKDDEKVGREDERAGIRQRENDIEGNR